MWWLSSSPAMRTRSSACSAALPWQLCPTLTRPVPCTGGSPRTRALPSALPWLAAVPLAMAAGIVLWGVVQGGFFTAITTLATEQIPELRGVVVALLSASTYLGVSLYTPLSALIYERAGYWAVGLEAACGCLLAAALLSRLPVESEPAQL